MIPKIIHYCWFGRKPKPEKVIEYINTWKEHCPDYEIIEWNEDNFDVCSLVYTREAYEMKKFAFVSDVCRLYALSQMGGIYMDTDVELLKSFDSLLHYSSFLGKEMPYKLSTAVIGASSSTQWVKDFLQTYNSKHFIWKFGKLNTIENTALLTSFFNQKYPLYEDEVTVFDIEYLSAKYFSTGKYHITPNTFAVHHFSGSWLQKKQSYVNRIAAMIKRYFKQNQIV